MTSEIREMVRENLAQARTARRSGNWDLCWSVLEDAHVLSQPWVWPHTRVHAAMLTAGWQARDAREVRGQLLRLLSGGPASAVRRYPTGNTGRTRISAIQPMPIRSDLAELLARAGQPTT
jgi:hypothetical protein